jgi:isopentenyl-diphosphate delta-isomerase
MGFSCDLTPLFHFTYRAPVGANLTEHEYDHVFVGRVTSVNIRPDPHEVTDWTWVAPSSLRADVQTAPHQYTVWFQRLLDPVIVDARSPVSPDAPASVSG